MLSIFPGAIQESTQFEKRFVEAPHVDGSLITPPACLFVCAVSRPFWLKGRSELRSLSPRLFASGDVVQFPPEFPSFLVRGLVRGLVCGLPPALAPGLLLLFPGKLWFRES